MREHGVLKRILLVYGEVVASLYVRTPAAKNDYFRRSHCQHGINDCIAYAQ